jgi:hypothetical protein
MNWGLRIVLVYIGFVAMILTLVFKARSEKIELVAPDYYEQEIVYQNRIEALQNMRSLSDSLWVTIRSGEVTVHFPEECYQKIQSGTLRFYRPSDATLDQSFLFDTEMSTAVTQRADQLDAGLYIVQCSWTMDSKNYYFEKSILLP